MGQNKQTERRKRGQGNAWEIHKDAETHTFAGPRISLKHKACNLKKHNIKLGDKEPSKMQLSSFCVDHLLGMGPGFKE